MGRNFGGSMASTSLSTTRFYGTNWDKLLRALDEEALASAASKADNARNKFNEISGVVAVNGEPVADSEERMDEFDAAISGMEAAEKETTATLTRAGNPLTPEKAENVARFRGANKEPEVVITLTLDPDDQVMAGILRDEAQRVVQICAAFGIEARVIEGKATTASIH